MVHENNKKSNISTESSSYKSWRARGHDTVIPQQDASTRILSPFFTSVS